MAVLALVLGAMLTGRSPQAMGQDHDNRVASGRSFVACDPSDPAFVCGLRNAEDLVRLAGTPWIVASHLNLALSGAGVSWGFGPLEAVSIDTREVRRLYPIPDAAVDWDRQTYPDCPAPPDSLSSVGLNVRRLSNHRFRLYVANRGGRESVEIIDVTIRAQRLVTTWRGCIRAPAGVQPNGLVPLPDDGVAVSGDGLAIWRPGRGWVGVRDIKGGNGVEVSRDGQWLFVAIMPDSAVVRVPVGGGAVDTILKSDFLPDNLRWGEDGRLYLAGWRPPEGFQLVECFKTPVCDIGFVVAQIDPETLTTKEVFRSEGIKGAFGLGTTALQVGNRFWIGSAFADRVAILELKP